MPSFLPTIYNKRILLVFSGAFCFDSVNIGVP